MTSTRKTLIFVHVHPLPLKFKLLQHVDHIYLLLPNSWVIPHVSVVIETCAA